MAKKWKFNRWRDRAVVTGSSVAAVGAYAAGLSQIFNPAALAVAGGVSAGHFVYSKTLSSVPTAMKWYADSKVKKGKWGVVPENASMSRLVADVSRQLGRKKPPTIYIIDDKAVASFALPFGLRWIVRKAPAELKKKIMQGTFAAVPGANIMVTTKEALASDMTEKELRFVVAHEMAHLKKDAATPALAAKQLIQKTTRILFWGTLAAGAAGVAGVTLPVVGSVALGGTAVGLGALIGTHVVGRALNNFGMRAVERRADRNAVYLTRDIDAAEGALSKIDPSSQKEKKGLYVSQLLLTHPTFHRRMKSLRKAFKKVSEYPEMKAGVQQPKPSSGPTPG